MFFLTEPFEHATIIEDYVAMRQASEKSKFA